MNRKKLFGYRDNKQWVDDRVEKIEQERECLQKMTATYGYSINGSSNIQDKLAESVVKLLDMNKEMLDFALNLKKELKEIDNTLLKIEQPYRNILTYVYIDGKSLVTVANDMNYSYREICRKHGTALKMYDKL